MLLAICFVLYSFVTVSSSSTSSSVHLHVSAYFFLTFSVHLDIFREINLAVVTARKKWRQNRNYVHAHYRILSRKRSGLWSKSENVRIQSDTCERLKTIRIRCVWTRKFRISKEIFAEKISGRVDMPYIRAWTNQKCLATKHHQTLFGEFGDQTCKC